MSIERVQSSALLSVGHAVPPHRLLQSDAAAAARRIFAHRYAAFERMAPVFETAGIRTRYTVKPLDWYFSNLDWPERNAAYLVGAQDLFVAAASRALANAACEARDVDTIVTISSTGIATPSLEARVASRMGFRSDVERVPVFGLGCAGGVSGLAIADRLARARPGSTVLLVAIEICTAAFRMDQLTSANMVATALFGDGAAAGVERASVDRFTCHPGGAKVITALEATLRLDQGTLDHERAVLEEYGNMSAPTVLFVLNRLAKQGLPRRTVLTALGPGFTCTCLSLAQAA